MKFRRVPDFLATFSCLVRIQGMKTILHAFILVSLLLICGPARAQDKFSILAAGDWLNVERPVTADDMKGRIVLLDFWTYGCVNCIQIVPDLTYLEEKFGDKLLIIGIHSAKFKGEQGDDRILAAAQRFGLKHPVINDSDFSIWDAFKVKAWPTLVLLDGNGTEISRYAGEGHRNEIEADIARSVATIQSSKALPAIAKTGKDVSVLWFPSKITKGVYKDEPLFFVSDTGHNRIVAFDETGKIKLTVGSGRQAFQDGTLKTAAFNAPHGLQVLGDRIFVADTGNHALRLVDLGEGTVKTLVGNGRRGSGKSIPYVDLADMKGVPATRDVELASPWDIKFIEDSRTTKFVIAMAGTHQLWLYDMDRIGILAGSGRETVDDGPLAEAGLAQPSGIALTGRNTIYFVDAESSALRTIENGRIKTLIGTGLFDFGLKDGSYPDALMQHPQGIASDRANKIYIADTYNNAIRVYDIALKTLTTLTVPDLELNEPADIFIDGMTLYVVDTGNHMIRKIRLLEDGKAAYDKGIKIHL